MPATELSARRLLKHLLGECSACRARYIENIAMLLNEHEELSDEQVEQVFIELSLEHVEH